MDRHMAASLDRWLTTPPEQSDDEIPEPSETFIDEQVKAFQAEFGKGDKLADVIRRCVQESYRAGWENGVQSVYDDQDEAEANYEEWQRRHDEALDAMEDDGI